MAEEVEEGLGKMSRHPLRTAGMAFIAGTMIGVSMAEAKKSHEKSSLQKLMDQLGL